MPRTHRTHAFSLVELSIVLVILGLLAGGIMVGQNMIRGAELKGVISDLSTYQTAYSNFRDKYQSMPGDMSDATNNWGIRAGGSGNDATCRDTFGSYTGTCNGNGDNRVDETATTTLFERFLFWQHLSLAGMIDGKFTGASGDATPELRVPGINMPKSTLGSTYGYLAAYVIGPQSGSAHYYDGTYLVNTVSQAHGMMPDEAWSVDTKIDNGIPATGAVWSLKQSSTWSPGCTTSDTAATAEYNVTNKSKICVIYMTLK